MTQVCKPDLGIADSQPIILIRKKFENYVFPDHVLN